MRLTDATVKRLKAPLTGNKVFYDATVPGFGCRVTAGGHRSFILNYRTHSGRERRYTIGSFPAWTVSAARAEAKELRKQIDQGGDPLADVQDQRTAPTVRHMVERYCEEHLPKKRPGSQVADRCLIKNYILPERGETLAHHKVSEIGFADIERLHSRITRAGKPIAANRVRSLLSKMLNLAILWQWRTDSPIRGVQRNQEVKRRRYLSAAELVRLTDALATHPDQQVANVIRLLLLTGARCGEVLAAEWGQFDFDAGVWTKPAALTKQRADHRVPLSAPARQLLIEIRTTNVGKFVFPGSGATGHRVKIGAAWHRICKAAQINGARLHDLRHTFASVLASSGLSLPVIGALLGHTQPATTARYSHLFDDPLRKATETAAAVITGRPSAEVVSLVKAK